MKGKKNGSDSSDSESLFNLEGMVGSDDSEDSDDDLGLNPEVNSDVNPNVRDKVDDSLHVNSKANVIAAAKQRVNPSGDPLINQIIELLDKPEQVKICVNTSHTLLI